MPNERASVEVFYSYAHEDELLRNELEKHLSILCRQGQISCWYDRQVVAGTNWAQAINTHLETASLILLLISSDFLASDYCYSIEMKRALERHESKEARVIPILLRPVDNWQSMPFGKMQVLPDDAIPVTRWPDRDEAFANITQGIRIALQDAQLHSAGLPSLTFPPIWNIPYARNPVFTGCTEILSHLHLQLQAGQAAALSQVQAISGLGGVGKTQIAVEYAYRYHRDYQTVLWTLADTRESLISGYTAIAKLLKLSDCDAEDQNITVQAVKEWLQCHKRWLLILDGADDLTILPEFVPPVLGGHLLLTTRAQCMGRLASRIEVETMNQDVGALFLLRRSGLVTKDASLATAPSSDVAVARGICKELGGLPLALDQAGAFIEETQCGLEEYLEFCRTRLYSLLERRGRLAGDHPESVVATWSLSFAKVEQQSPLAADLLRVFAFLPAGAIPVEIIMRGAKHLGPYLSKISADPLLLREAIAVLGDYSFTQRNEKDSAFSLHQLLQAVVRDAMQSSRLKLWKERILRAVLAVLPIAVAEHRSWLQWERLLSHAQLCISWIRDEGLRLPEDGTAILQRTGRYLMERGWYHEAEKLLVLAYEISMQEQGKEHLETARNADALALLYDKLGRWEEAEPLCKQACEIYGRLGCEDLSAIRSSSKLAWLQGRYAETEASMKRALEIKEELFGPGHPKTAHSLNNLACLYLVQDRCEEAEPLIKRALEINEQELGGDSPDTARSLHNLAILYDNQGKYEEAEQLFARAFAIRERALGSAHLDTAGSMWWLAVVFEHQQQYEKACTLYQRAFLVFDQVLGKGSSLIQNIHQQYISLLRKMGRDGEADELEM